MKFDPSITDGALLEVFQRFIGITGYRLWRIRIEKLEREISRYPILENVIHNRHPIELEVAKWRRHYAIPWRSPPVLRGPTAYRLIAFMAMVERVHRESTPKAKTRISGMIKDALKRKLSFFSLEHEFRTAAHLMHKGFDVYFTDLEGNETFDFLIKRNMNEIEVECKTVSVDSGRKIHRHDFEELLKLIHEDLLKYVHDDNSNNVIFITAFDRLKIGSQEIKNIRRALQINFTSSADIMNDHFHIMNLPYTPSSLPPNFESVRTDIRNEIGDSFFHSVRLSGCNELGARLSMTHLDVHRRREPCGEHHGLPHAFARQPRFRPTSTWFLGQVHRSCLWLGRTMPERSLWRI